MVVGVEEAVVVEEMVEEIQDIAGIDWFSFKLINCLNNQ